MRRLCNNDVNQKNDIKVESRSLGEDTKNKANYYTEHLYNAKIVSLKLILKLLQNHILVIYHLYQTTRKTANKMLKLHLQGTYKRGKMMYCALPVIWAKYSCVFE